MCGRLVLCLMVSNVFHFAELNIQNDPLQCKNPFSVPENPHVCFFLVFFFCAELNVTLQMMMLTVDFSFAGSWSADRLRSAAEFPCRVRLAADVRASYSNCEDKQVGRGRRCLSAREVAIQVILCAAGAGFLACTQCLPVQTLLPLCSGRSEHHRPQVAGSTCLAGKTLQGGSVVWHEFSGYSLCLSVNSLTVKFLLWVSQ